MINVISAVISIVVAEDEADQAALQGVVPLYHLLHLQ